MLERSSYVYEFRYDVSNTSCQGRCVNLQSIFATKWNIHLQDHRASHMQDKKLLVYREKNSVKTEGTQITVKRLSRGLKKRRRPRQG